jgi:hypothetical protein
MIFAIGVLIAPFGFRNVVVLGHECFLNLDEAVGDASPE